MSSDQYAQFIIQKCRLAVAIGVIQTKPEAKSLDQHITDLKLKINDEKMDEMTVCSDDFEMEFNDTINFENHLDTSQLSTTILKDFDDEFGHTSRENIFADVNFTQVNESQVKIQNHGNVQSTLCKTQAQSDEHIPRESLTDIDKTSCGSLAAINRDELITIDKACESMTKTRNTQNVTDKTIYKSIHKNPTIGTDKTNCEINQNITENVENTAWENFTNNNNKQLAKFTTNMDEDRQYIDQTTAFDSQATELYTLHTLTEDYTHVSQSQTNNFDISNKYLKGMHKSNDNQDKCNSVEQKLQMHDNDTEFCFNTKDVNLVKKINIKLGKVSNPMQREVDHFVKNTQISVGSSGYENENDNLKENTEFCHNFKDINLVSKINRKLNEDNIAIALVKENVQNNTTITTTAVNNPISIGENETYTEFECSFKDVNLARKVSNNLNKDNFDNIPMELDVLNFDLNIQADLSSKESKEKEDYAQGTQTPFLDENSEQILLNQFETNIFHNTATVHEISETRNENITMQVTNFSQNKLDLFLRNENNDTSLNTVKDISNTNVNTENMISQVIDLSQNVKPVENNKITLEHEISRPNVSNIDNKTMQVLDFSQNMLNSEQTKLVNDVESASVSSEEVTEIVPFKVMEELNRVKAYLNRKIERRMSTDTSLDSGYKSDSQSRSKIALQQSGAWVGQSAYCLFEHITRCPMVATTLEIVDEISQVLGQLIDRLHEEESYPSFLEELLEHVNTLIHSIHTEENLLLEKDEKIQRLFLLNKSFHIQKYSIEKLTDILENIHTSLTAKEELHELTNILEVENLSYIFHILEVIIKKNNKNKKNNESQTQSQDHPKRMSVSDIWRKKWNPHYKEDTKQDCGLDKKCVLTKCSEVLNKIVVGCLDGYSLIAYAALQCFNLLQSQ